MATLDWLIILAYFTALAGLTWWVLAKNKDTAEDYFLAGTGSWLVHRRRLDFRLQHRVRAPGGSGRRGRHERRRPWHTTSCTPGVCSSSAGCFVPFYLRSKVFTTPEFLERRFSGTARWVLSLISVVGYILTKIAVSIFAGGVVFAAVLPELGVDIAGHHFNASGSAPSPSSS